uniref:CYP71BE30 n=1 Tax=Sinopodophyllum hexandrum TaxID=93608 RepID=L7TC64_SINHE|nr:CYP71BE30 [Sinopodophyllum hexandrum]
MDLASILSLFSFFLLLLLLVKKGKRSQLPPGPWKLPLIGSLHHLLVGLPHHTLRDLAKKHGSLMHLQLGQVSTVVVTSPRIAKEMFKTHDIMFLDRPFMFAPSIVTYGAKDIVLAPYGEFWRQMRKISTLEVFSAKRVQSFQSVREDEVSMLIESISSMNGSVFNLTKRIFSFMNDLTARVAFGNKCKDQEAFVSMMDQVIKVSGGFGVADLYPSLEIINVISGLKSEMEGIHQKTDEILENIIKEHMQRNNNPNKDVNEEDIVDVLLRLQKDANLGFQLTSDNIKAVLFDIFSGGSETSSTVMDWAICELMKSPTSMEKVQREVRQVLNGKTNIIETDIHELKYLKSVIKETLRLHPPFPLLIPRECRERCEVDGYEIPVGTKIIVNAWAIGRDPQHWKDAEKFVPERFDEGSVDYKGAHFQYIPFGAGRRICPGISLGVANIELALAQLLYHFDWKLPNGVGTDELDMAEAFGLAVRRRKDLYVNATPYKSATGPC